MHVAVTHDWHVADCIISYSCTCNSLQHLCLTAKIVWCTQVERFLNMQRSLDLSTLPDSDPIEVQLLSHVLHLLKVRCSHTVTCSTRPCSKQCNGPIFNRATRLTVLDMSTQACTLLMSIYMLHAASSLEAG